MIEIFEYWFDNENNKVVQKNLKFFQILSINNYQNCDIMEMIYKISVMVLHNHKNVRGTAIVSMQELFALCTD